MVYPDSQDGIDEEPLASDIWDTFKNAHPHRKSRNLETGPPPPNRKRPSSLT